MDLGKTEKSLTHSNTIV